MLGMLVALLAVSVLCFGNVNLDLGKERRSNPKFALLQSPSCEHIPFLQIISIERIFEINHNKGQ